VIDASRATASAAKTSRPPATNGQPPPPADKAAKIVEISNIRHWATPSYTRVVIELGGPVQYQAARIANPDRIFFDLHGARLAAALRQRALPGDDGLLKRIRVAQNQAGIARVVLEVGAVNDYSAFVLPDPYRLVIDINGAPAKATPAAAASTTPPDSASEKLESRAALAETGASPGGVMASAEAPSSKPVFERVAAPAGKKSASSRAADQEKAPLRAEKQAASTQGARREAANTPRAAQPASDGHRSLIRALGLKIGRIVIDPGHGGHDTGTIGPTG